MRAGGVVDGWTGGELQAVLARIRSTPVQGNEPLSRLFLDPVHFVSSHDTLLLVEAVLFVVVCCGRT